MAEKDAEQKSADKRRACGMDKGIVRRTERYTWIPSDDNNRKQAARNTFQQETNPQTYADIEFEISMS